MRKHLRVTAPLLAGLVLVGCQKPPAEEIADAQRALSAAEKAAAQEYALDELGAADAAFDAAQAEVEAQDQRFALFRSYDHAKELLGQAAEQADAAYEAAGAAKEAARAAAESALADLETSLEEATDALAALADCPRKPKGFAADLEALNGRLDALSAETQPITEAVDNEKYREAAASAGDLSATLSTLRSDLQSARTKLGC